MLLVFIIALGLIVQRPATSNAQVSVAGLGALLGLLQQLQSNLVSILNSVDVSTQNRIHQVRVESESVIKSVEGVIKKGEEASDRLRANVAADAMALIRRIADITQSTSSDAFLKVNSTLIATAHLAASLPLINVDPFVLAIDPPRKLFNSKDRLIKVHGFFSGVDASRPIMIAFSNSSISMKASRAEGGAISFDLPERLMRPGEFVGFTIRVPRKSAWDWLPFSRGAEQVFDSRVYVPTQEPFSFLVEIFKEHPQLYSELRPAAPLQFTANSATTSNNKTLSAADIYSLLARDNREHDLADISIVALEHRVDAGIRPCSCCDASSGRLAHWNNRDLAFELHAPTCPSKWCSVTYHCGGGGTNAEIYLTPTIRIKRKNVPHLHVVSQERRTAMRRTTVGLDLPPDWKAIRITGYFRDGDQNESSQVYIEHEKGSVVDRTRWKVEISGQRAAISTFE